MPNELIQGIADAIAGGATAGLSKEAQMDFFGPFMQAQQARLARKEQSETRAYTSYSQSSKASREAFSSDPLADGKYQAYVSNAQQRLQLALDGTQSPAARQALTDTYEADIAFADMTSKTARERRNLDQGMRGDFGWLDQSPESQTSMTQLTAEGSPLSKSFSAAQEFAAKFTDQSTGVFDASALPSTALNTDERALVSAVGQIQGGLPAYVAANPEKGQHILGLLSKVDAGSLGARQEEITKIRDDNMFFGRLKAMENHDERMGKLKALNEEELWQVDANGVRSFRPTAIDRAINVALDAAGPTRNAAVAWQLVENTYGRVPGVDLSNIQSEIFQAGNIGSPSATEVAQIVDPVKEAGIGIFSKGLPTLTVQERREIYRGNFESLEGEYTPQEAEALAALYQGNGRSLVLEPMMGNFLGSQEHQAAQLNVWQDIRDAAAATGDERRAEQADLQIKQLQAFQSNPGVDAQISAVTELMLHGAADGKWDNFIQTVGRESTGVLDTTGGVSEAANTAWEEQVMRDGLSPANQLRAAARWAVTHKLVFHQDSQIETGGGVKLNPLATSKFLDVAEKWAQSLEQEQMAMPDAARQFIGAGDSIHAPQIAFLRLATIDSVQDLGTTKDINALGNPRMREITPSDR